MEETDRPMSPLTKVVFWFVAANALVGAVSSDRENGSAIIRR